MAKTTNCVFCDKELTKGFFKGEDWCLNVGAFDALTCCEDCYNKFEETAKLEKKRFGTKMENLQKTKRKKFSEKEIASMFCLYLDEKKHFEEKSAYQILDVGMNSFSLNDEGFFSVKEFKKSDGDTSARKMLKNMDKAREDSDCYAFDKNDITKIEYAKNGMGDFNGLFQKVYSFTIRLNDESKMTYKPCITKVVSYGGGFAFGYQRSAEKRLIRILNDFKNQIGSDLPIVKVKKI